VSGAGHPRIEIETRIHTRETLGRLRVAPAGQIITRTCTRQIVTCRVFSLWIKIAIPCQGIVDHRRLSPVVSSAWDKMIHHETSMVCIKTIYDDD
jgi:hypothetical protein